MGDGAARATTKRSSSIEALVSGGQRASEGSIDSRRATTDLEREQRVRARRRVRERGRHDARVGSRAMRRLTEASSFGFVRVGSLLSSVRSRSVATCPKTGYSVGPPREPDHTTPPRRASSSSSSPWRPRRSATSTSSSSSRSSTRRTRRTGSKRGGRCERVVASSSNPIPSHPIPSRPLLRARVR